MDVIPFNKPFLTGNEINYIQQCLQSGRLAGDGNFTRKVHQFFEQRYRFKKVLLTASCTDALEMAAMLLNIKPGDEIIMPSYTFVSTANAFALKGAKIVFCDSRENHPNMDESDIEKLINPKTKAIVAMHYAGMGCNMERLLSIAKEHHLFLVEDAAHGINGYYKNIPLGSFGNLAAMSFNETKNIISGEGGLLIINDGHFTERAEIIREKGTNRTAFNRGETSKYEWLDIGSSFAASDIIAALLFAQLEAVDSIQESRLKLWNQYYNSLKEASVKFGFELPAVPDDVQHNAHIFYIVCKSTDERNELIAYLSAQNIKAAFHYLSLHKSPYFSDKHDGRQLPNADKFSDCLLRLPLFNDLNAEQVNYVAEKVVEFYSAKH
jgi:dTDP-4-amino-4,6-dideoxygalactose transaminase